MNNRITYLDGHRGLAILMVIVFHSYVKWPNHVPYGSEYADIAFFKFGWLGVNLFFLISGFVILMTLEKCKGIKEFIYRRWLRLFPAMAFCSVLIFATSELFPERPAGEPSLISLIPGLTFIDLDWWSFIFGGKIKPLEGSFWSLYVEFKFYIFAAFIYYFLGRNWMLFSLVLANVVTVLFKTLNKYFPIDIVQSVYSICEYLSFSYFGWFATGGSLYVYSKTHDKRWLYTSIALALFCSVFVRGIQWRPALAAFTIAAFFIASVSNKALQSVLSHKWFQFFGFISYPLYLIHENMLVSMIAMVPRWSQFDWGGAILPITILSIAAFFISKYVEAYVKNSLVSFLRFSRIVH